MANGKWNTKYRTYQLARTVVEFITNLPNEQIYWSFKDQLIKSATSIAANVIEAQAASSKREFAKFYQIALKSANETKFWLCLLRDTKLAEFGKIKPLLQDAIEIAKMLGSALLTLKGKNIYH